jgi:hypothetical protein
MPASPPLSSSMGTRIHGDMDRYAAQLGSAVELADPARRGQQRPG